ncbi:superinfection immunity protein [Chryseobacterium sp. MIQD13]|uniref:superinfection immunity protein n=1 Tax=Chryseobacterium sp. MIQD13 TaxID=3422310 RepID=UPI003D2A1C20
MLLLISTTSSKSDGSLFFRIILLIYFLPTIVGFFRIPIIKYRFITVFFINTFLGFTVVGWWLSFMKAVSSHRG